jgi:hypothetical protein
VRENSLGAAKLEHFSETSFSHTFRIRHANESTIESSFRIELIVRFRVNRNKKIFISEDLHVSRVRIFVLSNENLFISKMHEFS